MYTNGQTTTMFTTKGCRMTGGYLDLRSTLGAHFDPTIRCIQEM